MVGGYCGNHLPTITTCPFLRLTTEGTTEFAGWARMALPISSFAVIEVCPGRRAYSLSQPLPSSPSLSQVGKPNVGENRPSRVRADIAVELTVGDTVKYEWEGMQTQSERMGGQGGRWLQCSVSVDRGWEDGNVIQGYRWLIMAIYMLLYRVVQGYRWLYVVIQGYRLLYRVIDSYM